MAFIDIPIPRQISALPTPMAPREALLPLLDAAPEQAEGLLRSVSRHLIDDMELLRVAVYLAAEDTLSLTFSANADDTENETTHPSVVPFSDEELSGPDLFEPEQSLLIPTNCHPVERSRSAAQIVRLGGRVRGIFMAEAAHRREWDHGEMKFLGEMFVRALTRVRHLRAQETETHLLDTLMQHLPDAIYFKDSRSRFIRASRQVIVQNGFLSFDQLQGKTDFDLFTHEHAAQAFRDEETVMRTGTPIIAKEEKETWPDGRETWVLTTKMPFRDRQGNAIGTFGMSRDITQLRQTQVALLQSQEMLRQRYQAMENDLAQARVIQMALLPAAPPEYKQLQIRFRYEPLDAIGGDFFSFRRLPNGGLAVFLGDLTGHGVSAALFMSLVRCMTERVFETEGHAPSTYMEALDRSLMNQIPHGFITAIYCLLEPQPDGSVRLTWCGAGHPDPIVWRRSTGKTEQLPGGDGAIGIFEEFPRVSKTVSLAPGDRLFLYTDGIPESLSPAGAMLGFDEIGAAIEDSTAPELEDTLDRLLTSVRHHRGGAAAEDDIALIGIQVTEL